MTKIIFDVNESVYPYGLFRAFGIVTRNCENLTSQTASSVASDQTAWMDRLIWPFSECRYPKNKFFTAGLLFCEHIFQLLFPIYKDMWSELSYKRRFYWVPIRFYMQINKKFKYPQSFSLTWAITIEIHSEWPHRLSLIQWQFLLFVSTCDRCFGQRRKKKSPGTELVRKGNLPPGYDLIKFFYFARKQYDVSWLSSHILLMGLDTLSRFFAFSLWAVDHGH